MIVCRIAYKKYAENLSASGFAGRWNSEGKLVLYTAENISPALLENMIYRMGTGFNDDYKIMLIEIPDGSWDEINPENLLSNWREPESYPELQLLGNAWYDAQKSLCLKVPSSVLPQNFNFMLNTIHPDFHKVKLIAVLPFVPDQRLEDLLKKYHK